MISWSNSWISNLENLKVLIKKKLFQKSLLRLGSKHLHQGSREKIFSSGKKREKKRPKKLPLQRLWKRKDKLENFRRNFRLGKRNDEIFYCTCVWLTFARLCLSLLLPNTCSCQTQQPLPTSSTQMSYSADSFVVLFCTYRCSTRSLVAYTTWSSPWTMNICFRVIRKLGLSAFSNPQ